MFPIPSWLRRRKRKKTLMRSRTWKKIEVRHVEAGVCETFVTLLEEPDGLKRSDPEAMVDGACETEV